MPLRTLSPELAEQAKVELNEDPRRLEDGIQHLKEWIHKQSYLRARDDDQWLATFLRGCKHSVERAKEKLDLYYSLRSTAPDLFSPKYSEPKFMELLKSGVVLVLPKSAGPTSPRVSIIRANQYDPNKYFVTELLALTLVMQQILYLEDDSFVVSGGINVVDLEGATIAHFLQMTPTQMKKMVVIGQEASPIRLKSAHYIGTPPGFEKVFNIGKKILTEKHKNKIHLHQNMDELYEFVPKEILPVEFGGNGGTVQEIIDDIFINSEEPEVIDPLLNENEILNSLDSEAAATSSSLLVNQLPKTSELDNELDENILEMLGETPSKTKKFSAPIQKELAIRWEHISTNGLPKDTKKHIMDKYNIPENCIKIQPPQLNPEIKVALSETLTKKDKAIENKQLQQAVAIGCLGQALTKLFTKENKDTEVIQLLIDAGRLLCDHQHTESMSRRSFVCSTIKKDIKEHLYKTDIDSFLFGEQLAETLRTAKAINKSGSELRTIQTKPSQIKPHQSQYLNARPLFPNNNRQAGTTRRTLPATGRAPKPRHQTPLLPPPPPPPPPPTRSYVRTQQRHK